MLENLVEVLKHLNCKTYLIVNSETISLSFVHDRR
jgi:hypothetical protein